MWKRYEVEWDEDGKRVGIGLGVAIGFLNWLVNEE